VERDRNCQHDCLQWLTVCCEIENSQQTADVKGWIPRFHTRVIWCCKLRLWHAIRFQLKKTQQRDDWRKLDTILYVSRCRILWWGYWSDMRSVKPFIVPPATKKDGCVALCWLDYSLLQCHFNLHIYNKIIICILELENIITSALSCVPKTSMNKQCGRRVQPTWYAPPSLRPSVTLIFDRLTLKLLCEAHLRWKPSFQTGHATPLRFWVYLLELFTIYATDGQTDRWTGGWTKTTLIAPFPMVGGISWRQSWDASGCDPVHVHLNDWMHIRVCACVV